MLKARSIVPFLAAAAGLAMAAHAAPPAADFVKQAGASDIYELQSSKLVMASKNPGVKSFAQEMVKDHTQSTQQVKAAARADGLTPRPPMLMAEQKANIQALTAAKGAQRDTLYIQQQKAAHQQALALHQGYASDGDKPALKAAAGKIAPIVQHHMEMLNQMPAM